MPRPPFDATRDPSNDGLQALCTRLRYSSIRALARTLQRPEDCNALVAAIEQDVAALFAHFRLRMEQFHLGLAELPPRTILEMILAPSQERALSDEWLASLQRPEAWWILDQTLVGGIERSTVANAVAAVLETTPVFTHQLLRTALRTPAPEVRPSERPAWVLARRVPTMPDAEREALQQGLLAVLRGELAVACDPQADVDEQRVARVAVSQMMASGALTAVPAGILRGVLRATQSADAGVRSFAQEMVPLLGPGQEPAGRRRR